MHVSHNIRCAALAAAAAISVSSAASAQTLDIVAISNQAVPGGNGAMFVPGLPSIDDTGRAVFGALLTGTSGGLADDTALYAGNGITPVVQIAREGASAAGDGAFSNLSVADHPTGPLGAAAFAVNLTGTSLGVANNLAIFRGDGSSAPVQIVRESQAVPGGNGTFSNVSSPTINSLGQVGFHSTLLGTSGGGTDNTGIYRGDGASITQIARMGQPAPSADGTYLQLLDPDINDVGQLAFVSTLAGTSGGTADNVAVVRTNGITAVEVARKGLTVPGGNGTYNSFNQNISFNNTGQIAFFSGLAGTSGGATDDTGVFRANGVTVVALAREGQASPSANGTLAGFQTPSLNNAGQAVMNVAYLGTTGGVNDNSGILRTDGAGVFVEVVREGDQVPGNTGAYAGLGLAAFNDLNQTAFLSNLRDTPGVNTDNVGIFFNDPTLGTLTVVRKGDMLLGSPILGLDFAESTGAAGDELSGLNNLGQVAFQFSLVDGRSGVAIWSVPEPTSAMVLAMSAVGALGIRSRRRR